MHASLCFMQCRCWVRGLRWRLKIYKGRQRRRQMGSECRQRCLFLGLESLLQVLGLRQQCRHHLQCHHHTSNTKDCLMAVLPLLLVMVVVVVVVVLLKRRLFGHRIGFLLSKNWNWQRSNSSRTRVNLQW